MLIATSDKIIGMTMRCVVMSKHHNVFSPVVAFCLNLFQSCLRK